jgi:hypothetical protein
MASSERLHGTAWWRSRLKLVKLAGGALLAAHAMLVGGAALAAQCADSLYTSVGEAACRPVAVLDAGRRIVSGQGEFAFECQAPPGLKLFLVTDDARSWYALELKGKMHSLEQAIAYENPPGHFPNVGKGDRVEWRLENASPVGLIFRVSYQSADATKSFSRLFAIDLRGEEPKLLGMASSNEAARAMIDRCKD